MKKNKLSSWIKTGKDQTRKLALSVIVFSGAQLGAQVSYTFTPAGATGSIGPTQAQVNTAYASTNLNGSVSVIGQGIQTFTIPISGAYGITALGGQGCGPFGGRGAQMYGEFNFTAGQVIQILVGQKSDLPVNTSANFQYGGGGGSFIATMANVPLVVAGGGGGSWAGSYTSNTDAPITTSGKDGFNGPTNGIGGTNGQGGGAAANGDGGAGFLTDGLCTSTAASPAKAFVNGGVGGTYSFYGVGGFGGGGGTSSYNNTRCGGGGGYSGGGGAGSSASGTPEGGGGGSYNAGTNQNNIAGVNVGEGKVIITRLCDVNLTASSNPICMGSAVTLSTNAGSNIQWSSGSTASSISVSPANTTQYTVTGTSSSTSACTSTLVITVTVNPLPALSVVVTPSVLCVGNTATTTASGAASYAWNTGMAGTTATFNPLVNTVYTVTGTDNLNCVNTKTVEVVVNTNVLSLTSNTTICEGKSLMLVASGAVTYSWNSGNPFPNLPVSPVNTTTYSVTGTDIHNCNISNSVVVTVNPKPAVAVNADKNIVCLGEVFDLTASGASTYVWSNNSTGNTLSVTPSVDVIHTYTVTGTDNNSCSNTAVVSVTVSRCSGIGEQNTLAGSVSVYPNPGSGIFALSAGVSAGTITVTDLSGRTVLTSEITGNQTELNMSAYASGIYYVHVQSASATDVIKIIKH